MSRGPVPSQLYLLSNLPALPISEKVRFLGCVISYSTSSACLALAHLYPKDTNVSASVDVSLLLESLTAEQTRVGEFVNVIGYITEQKIIRDKKPPCQESKQKYEKLLDPNGSLS